MAGTAVGERGTDAPAPSVPRPDRTLGFRLALRAHRRRFVTLAVVLLLAIATFVGDAILHARLDARNGELAAAVHHLSRLRASQRAAAGSLGTALRVGDARKTTTAQVSSEIATTEQQLAGASNTSALQTLDLAELGTCVNGVSTAADAIAGSNVAGAVASINAVSSTCLSLEGTGGAGLVYPFDFPDPFVLTTSSGYFAFATNSAAGNIQIIQSADLTHWTTTGDALPHLPGWAQPSATWAPSVLQRGSSYVMYYSAVYGTSGEQCISEAVASQPQGPYLDSSQWPIVCQLSLGGSIDPSPVVTPDGTAYLLWKSQGANGQGPALWAQQLTPDGTGLAPGSPSALLQPDQTWQHGYVEGPSMIDAGGQFLLFYSGSDWKTATYGVGYATCSAPLGPCTDQSVQPLLGSQPSFSGPGGASVFADNAGKLWIAFHAWLPGRVGFPFSRPLFIRPVSVAGGVPQVGP